MASTLLKSARQGAYIAIALYVTIIFLVTVIGHISASHQQASASVAQAPGQHGRI